MFEKKEQENIKDVQKKLAYAKERIEDLEIILKNERHNEELNKLERESHEKLVQKEHEFALKHFKDEEMLRMSKELTETKEKLSVAIKEIELYKKIVDTNAAIIDVKKIIEDLIKKLPTVDINNIHVSGNSAKN